VGPGDLRDGQAVVSLAERDILRQRHRFLVPAGQLLLMRLSLAQNLPQLLLDLAPGLIFPGHSGDSINAREKHRPAKTLYTQGESARQNLPRHCRQRPSQEWIEVHATSVFHAAVYYCGACAARPGGPPAPEPHHFVTVRVTGKEYRVREQRVRDWANAKAERDAQARFGGGRAEESEAINERHAMDRRSGRRLPLGAAPGYRGRPVRGAALRCGRG
jgi:hypothetical protein